MAESGGMILKGEDGSLYFIRDEVLEASKMEGEDLERYKPLADGEEPETEGFAYEFQQTTNLSQVGRVQSSNLVGIDQAVNLRGDRIGRTSTIMCPW
jgi:hypothetical protein